MKTQQLVQEIPEEYFNYWANKFCPAEIKVLLCICKKTFCTVLSDDFEEDSLFISIQEIEKLTQLKKQTLKNAIRSLEDCGLLLNDNQKGDKCSYLIDAEVFAGNY